MRKGEAGRQAVLHWIETRGGAQGLRFGPALQLSPWRRYTMAFCLSPMLLRKRPLLQTPLRRALMPLGSYSHSNPRELKNGCLQFHSHSHQNGTEASGGAQIPKLKGQESVRGWERPRAAGKGGREHRGEGAVSPWAQKILRS